MKEYDNAGLENKNIIFFTMHRSGSMVTHYICQQICEKIKINYYSPNDPAINGISAFFNRVFWKGKKGCFGPLRCYIEVPNIDECDIILHLRDPRDVLVSMFYSYCYSHQGQIEPDTGIRKEVAMRGIDDFVLYLSCGQPSKSIPDSYGTGRADFMGNVLERYESYILHLLNKSNVIFVKYEEMVTDFQSWFAKIIEPFNFPYGLMIEPEALNKGFSVPVENKNLHKRKVTPGDYKEKLKPETITQLNERFGVVLEKLGYD